MRQLPVNKEEIASFCRKHRVRRLAFFGSVLREDFRPDSDVDGLIRMAEIELELSALLGRKVDLRTPAELSRYYRQEVLQGAVILYAA